MKEQKKNINQDIIEIKAQLLSDGKKIQSEMLNTAFKISISDEDLAYNLGLWCKWIKVTDPQLGFSLKDEMNRLHKIFNDTPAEDYFLLNKIFKRNFRYYYFALLAVGLFILYSGISLQISGIQSYAIGYRLLPVIKNGATIGFVGLLVCIASFINLYNDVKRKQYYRLLK